VNQFDGNAGVNDLFPVRVAELAGDLSEEGAESFPSRQEEMLSDLGQERVVGDGHLGEAPLHAFHAIPHIGERNELVESWCIHVWTAW